MRPCKIKLDGYDLRVVVTGLMKYRADAPNEVLEVMGPIILRLCDIEKALKPGKRTKCPFSPAEKRLVRLLLNEWRNQLIQDNNLGGVDGVTEVMLKFSK